MTLPLPPVAKVAIGGLLLLGGLAGYAIFTREVPSISTIKAHREEPPPRRGDDPTYADELRKMTTLLQDMRYRFDQAENARVQDRDQAERKTQQAVQEATRQATQQSQQAVDRLSQALKAAQEAVDQKIKEATTPATDSALKTEIDRLKEELSALHQAGTSERDAAARVRSALPEANRVLAPPVESSAKPPTPPKEGVLGAAQLAPDLLQQLQQIPGLEDFRDRLASLQGGGSPGAPSPVSPLERALDPNQPPLDGEVRSGASASSKRLEGLKGHYVTLTPYGTRGTSTPPVTTSATTAVSLAPKTYPFTVRPGKDGASAVIPIYTIPDAATLVNNATMTPLVGRVPFRNNLRDPFRFKLITGATNLATNGHRIPGIVNAVWTGYAVGVREQSCVRAYLDTVTFTFEDGRLHTVRKGKGDTDATASVVDNLGYLTDRWGKPCIRGRYFNNAGSYLKDRGIAAFLDGLANAYAQSQLTTQRESGTLSTYLSGNTYEYALGKGLGNTANEIAHYVAERAEDAFDVVYVPSGIDVQIFVEDQIPIDYDTNGRKLQYDYRGADLHAQALD
ncbi:putative Integrating conjugative element protein, PFL_4705 family [Candidatus Competibacter denitrificans Run_A_D11]|uniref:Integrating conjugative element protein, PFL_4705 family n=1 Tax=Candidatus Competibacter denitrificans Run_A_D11 TaxID=1400863 RepID=W6M6R5_9GAMM|nr:TIGR03752 family integrating conjugative element protein [Candidatus Competibacter denitrificans]CDI02319.1 putative Integrating conjugative element protein, PFL_4705 family [Candidatus Competibacter denitrificans Run_A_D11]